MITTLELAPKPEDPYWGMPFDIDNDTHCVEMIRRIEAQGGEFIPWEEAWKQLGI